MALYPIIFYVSIVDGSLVNYAGGALAWPALYQGDTRDLQIAVVIPTGQANAPWQIMNLQGYTMYVTMGTTPKGDGSQTIYAGPLAMTWSPTLNAFPGSLNLTTSNLATAIGTGPSIGATVDININNGGVPQTLYQNTITIYAPENPGGVVVPSPTVNYLTATQTAQQFVPQNGGAAGQGFIMISPAGNKFFGQINDQATLVWQPLQ